MVLNFPFSMRLPSQPGNQRQGLFRPYVNYLKRAPVGVRRLRFSGRSVRIAGQIWQGGNQSVKYKDDLLGLVLLDLIRTRHP